MPTSAIIKVDLTLTEGGDYLATTTLVGPDGTTPVQPAAIQTLTASLLNLEPGGGVVFSARNVKSYAGADGAFEMPLLHTDLAVAGSRRFTRFLLTLVLVQTNGRQSVQPIEFYVENAPGL